MKFYHSHLKPALTPSAPLQNCYKWHSGGGNCGVTDAPWLPSDGDSSRICRGAHRSAYVPAEFPFLKTEQCKLQEGAGCQDQPSTRVLTSRLTIQGTNCRQVTRRVICAKKTPNQPKTPKKTKNLFCTV